MPVSAALGLRRAFSEREAAVLPRFRRAAEADGLHFRARGLDTSVRSGGFIATLLFAPRR